MATRFGVDYGNAVATGERIKAARTQNIMSDLALDDAISERRSRPVRKNLREKAVSGDNEAARKLLAIYPKNAPAFLQSLNSMDDRQLAEVKRNAEEIGKASSWVLQGANDQEKAIRYQQVLDTLPEELLQQMPPEFNERFVGLSLARSAAMADALDAPTVTTEGGENVTYRLGIEESRSEKPPKGGKGGSGGVKAADESLIFKQSAELLGGIFDKDGKLQNLDPETRNVVQAIATDAANLFSKGGVTRSESVTRAAKQRGYNVITQNGKQKIVDPKDPDSIKQFLLSK